MSCRTARMILLLAALLLLSPALYSSRAQVERKPVLVIFPGVAETSADLVKLGQAAADTGAFTEVVIASYDWKTDSIPDAAPRIFASLDRRFPGTRFVLLGNREGGLVAEWMATKVKGAEGRVARVITLNSPLEGMNQLGLNSGTGANNIRHNSGVVASDGTTSNNLYDVNFVRVWEKDSPAVARDSALRPSPVGGETRRLVVRTKPYDARAALPQMVEALRADYRASAFEKVVAEGKEILAIDRQQPDVSLLTGISYYGLGLGQSTATGAAEMYGASYQPLADALDAGLEVTLPVKHHHALFLDQDLCSGYIKLTRDTFAFLSNEVGSHSFSVPLSKIYELSFEPQNAGRLHTRVGIQGKRREEKKNFNFHSAEVKLVQQTKWLTPTAPITSNNIYCTVACVPSMDVVYRLILHALSVPARPSGVGSYGSGGGGTVTGDVAGGGAEARLRSAEEFARKRQWSDAEAECREALRLAPDDPLAYQCLGGALAAQQHWSDAEAVYGRAAKLEPDNAQWFLDLGGVLNVQRKWDAAEAAYREALRLAPHDARVLNDLGYLLVDHDKSLDEATRMIEEAVRAEPSNGYYLDSLGWAYFKLNRLEEAARLLQEAARQRPKSATIQEHIGDLYQRRGDNSKARSAWRKALELAPDDTEQRARLTNKLAR